MADAVSDAPHLVGDALYRKLADNKFPLLLKEAILPYYDDLDVAIIREGYPLIIRTQGREHYIELNITRELVRGVIDHIPNFRSNGRSGMNGTLHRFARIRNNQNDIIGVSIRKGRYVFGVAEPFRKYLAYDSQSADDLGPNIMLIGPPEVGKTTVLRDMTRILVTKYGSQTLVVDTSCEIGGDGDVPIPQLMPANFCPVSRPEQQLEVMLEGLRNHGPKAVVLDELGYQGDVMEAVSLTHRGVRVLCSVHGTNLERVVDNRDYEPMLGGINADRSRLLSAVPPFDIAIEVKGRNHFIVHEHVKTAVERVLQGQPPGGIEIRPGNAHTQPIFPVGSGV